MLRRVVSAVSRLLRVRQPKDRRMPIACKRATADEGEWKMGTKIELNVHVRAKWLTSVLIVLLPFITCGIILFFNGYKLRFSMLVPTWNDEVSWWLQVQSMIKYGKNLGYYGYNGTHAAIGTAGAWGDAILLPYCLFGKIFGWKLYSMSLANMTFLSLALFIYLVLTKPDGRQKIKLTAVYFCLTITIGYSLTSMAEGLRYSLGIILVSLLIWLERRTRQNNQEFSVGEALIYTLIAVFLYYTVWSYLIFALVVPLFCWLFLRRFRPVFRGGISFLATIFVAASAHYVSSLTSAPYVTSAIREIIQVIREDGLYTGGGMCWTRYLQTCRR